MPETGAARPSNAPASRSRSSCATRSPGIHPRCPEEHPPHSPGPPSPASRDCPHAMSTDQGGRCAPRRPPPPACRPHADRTRLLGRRKRGRQARGGWQRREPGASVARGECAWRRCAVTVAPARPRPADQARWLAPAGGGPWGCRGWLARPCCPGEQGHPLPFRHQQPRAAVEGGGGRTHTAAPGRGQVRRRRGGGGSGMSSSRCLIARLAWHLGRLRALCGSQQDIYWLLHSAVRSKALRALCPAGGRRPGRATAGVGRAAQRCGGTMSPLAVQVRFLRSRLAAGPLAAGCSWAGGSTGLNKGGAGRATKQAPARCCPPTAAANAKLQSSQAHSGRAKCSARQVHVALALPVAGAPGDRWGGVGADGLARGRGRPSEVDSWKARDGTDWRAPGDPAGAQPRTDWRSDRWGGAPGAGGCSMHAACRRWPLSQCMHGCCAACRGGVRKALRLSGWQPRLAGAGMTPSTLPIVQAHRGPTAGGRLGWAAGAGLASRRWTAAAALGPWAGGAASGVSGRHGQGQRQGCACIPGV